MLLRDLGAVNRSFVQKDLIISIFSLVHQSSPMLDYPPCPKSTMLNTFPAGMGVPRMAYFPHLLKKLWIFPGPTKFAPAVQLSCFVSITSFLATI